MATVLLAVASVFLLCVLAEKFSDKFGMPALILIFFLIGLLTFPHQMPEIVGMALCIVVFLTLIARPLVAFLLLRPMKCGIRQCGLIV